jgi:hypothetical protein
VLRSRKTSAVISVLVASAAFAGCGGSSSSGKSPEAYVKAVCSAIGPFQKDVQAKSSALDVSNLTSPAAGKQALVGFMAAVVADTEKAVSGLKGAGTPNITNGKTISTAIVNAFGQLKTALQQAQAQTGNLPTNSAVAFKAAAQTLGASIRTSVGAIGSSLSGLKSPALEKAAKSVPECQSLGS